MITINLLPAGYGDTILIQLEPEEKDSLTTNLLVDCGFNFKKNILPRIKVLKEAGMKKIDRFIITHYDSDHISSARSFIKLNGNHASAKLIPIDQVWINTFRHLQDEKRQDNIPENDQKIKEFIDELPALPEPDAEYEIGAEQASLLGIELLKNGYPWNTDFNKKSACVEHGPVVIVNDVKLTLLSPNKTKLKMLEDDFIEVMEKHGIETSDTELLDDALELFLQQGGQLSDLDTTYEIAANAAISEENIRELSKGEGYKQDTDAANGSSIAFIIEAQGKKILMLADAHAEQIMAELEHHCPDKASYPIFFDAVKVAHHGSFKNNRPELFNMIDSPIFLFSTNGRHQSHQHPDLQTIACIINRPLRHNMTCRKLIFNYELEHLEGLNNEALKSEFKFEVEESTIITL